MGAVQEILPCPKCNRKWFVYEFETKSCEEWGACQACGYGFQRYLELRCIDCGKDPSEQREGDFDVYTIRYHEVTKYFMLFSEHYGLPIMKCPNCNSFRMLVDMVEKMEPPRLVVIPESALRPAEELLLSKDDGRSVR